MTDTKYIIEKVGLLFRKYGIKSITMDDVAREMGMSKKTLYQLISDKNELIQSVVQADFREIRDQLGALNNEECDAVQQLINIQKLICDFLSRLSLAVDYDLRKYYSEIYDEIREEYLSLFDETLRKNIERGKAQNLYRDDVDEKVISMFHLNLIDQIPHSTIISIEEFTSKHFVEEICTYHLNGLVNDNGRKLLEKYKEEIENLKKSETI